MRSVRSVTIPVAALALLLLTFQAGSAVGQITNVTSFEAYESGTRGVARIVVGDAFNVDGVRVELPQGWEIMSVHVWSPAAGLRPASTNGGDSPSSIVVRIREKRSTTLLVRFRASDVPGDGDVVLAPVIETESGMRSLMSDAVRVRASTREVPSSSRDSDNRVASFPGPGIATIVTGAAVVSPDRAHTVSFWIQTTATDEFILSDWSGDDLDSYGMELMVSPDGSLAYYRGFPGRHESMKSPSLVADGKWHHVAVTHDPARRWTRLYIDGTPADSLRLSSLWHVSDDEIVLGGRATGATPPSDAGDLRARFTGRLDDVAVWRRALDGESIQRQLAEPMVGQGADVVVDFEDEEWSTRVNLVSTQVSRRDPLRHFSAQIVAGTVELTWESSDVWTDDFVVDRSSDGIEFEAIGRVSPSDAVAGRFVHVDRAVVDEVAYYRVRQVFSSGGSLSSPTIKIGMADVMETPGIDETTVAVSNFPNPFRASTSIRYEIPEEGRVQLSVWDLSGQPVATLVDETVQAGFHETDFDGSDLSAGTYFVRLQLGARIVSHKLLLVR